MSTVTEKMERGQEAIARIVNKCHEDENFKANLFADPQSAIEELFGRKLNLPDDKEIKVVDQMDDRYIYINVPQKLKIEDLELTDEELEQVSGGSFWGGVAAGIAATAIYDFACGMYDGFTDGE